MARTESKFASSLIAGLLMIPVSAVAAFAIVSNTTATPAQAPATTAAVVDTTVVDTTTPATTTSTVVDTIVVAPVEASAADYTAACGLDGLALVEMETADLLDDVQKAALDALRQVCSELGMSLPDPAAPPPQVITVTASGSGSTASSPVQATFAPSGEYEHDDDDHEEHEEHEEHEDHD